MNVVTLTVLSSLCTLSTMQLVWWPSGFTCKCRHTDCIVITVPIVNRAVCLITFRFHTQISSHWLLYCRSTQCQLSSHSDDISVSHENVIILTAFIVTANFIILETPPPHQKNEKKAKHTHTHHYQQRIQLDGLSGLQSSHLLLYHHCKVSDDSEYVQAGHTAKLAMLQLYLHSRLKTRLHWIGQRQLQDETRYIWLWDLDRLKLNAWRYTKLIGLLVMNSTNISNHNLHQIWPSTLRSRHTGGFRNKTGWVMKRKEHSVSTK